MLEVAHGGRYFILSLRTPGSALACGKLRIETARASSQPSLLRRISRTHQLQLGSQETHFEGLRFVVAARMAMALRWRGCARLCGRSVSLSRSLHLGPLEQPDSPQPQPQVDSKFTNFGFREVPEQEKSKLVGEVFSNVASNYDLMNDLMSGGLHRLWKDRLVSKLAPFPGMQHLDVAGGTGDVAFRVVEAIKKAEQRIRGSTLADADEEDRTRVYVCDINPDMLEIGKKRAKERGLGNAACLVWMEGDAEALTLKDESVDGYTIAFGIRNVTHIDRALKEAYRVLRRGGRFLCLELSHVSTPGFKEIYDAYSFNVIPRMGEVVSGDRASYQYLVESVRKFPNQERFGSMIADAGFKEVEYENLVGGVVAIHSGFKL